MDGQNETKKDSRNLRLRLGATIAALAVVAMSLSALLVASAASSHLVVKTKRQLYTSYAIAGQKSGPIGTDARSNRTKPPPLPASTIESLDLLCRDLHVNLAYLPDFEVSAIRPPSTSQIPIGGIEGTAAQDAKYSYGYQPPSTLAELATDPNVSSICKGNNSPGNVAYIGKLEPLGKLPGYDLVVTATSENLYQILAGSGWKLWLAIIATLALAALGMYLAGRQLREATLGMSPTQLASVIEEQQALLEGIYEGVIGLDGEGRIRFFNNEAQRLLNLPKRSAGRPLSVLVRGSRLKAVLTQQITGSDLPVVVGDSVLIINNIEVTQNGRSLGHVITIRDQTEQEGLLKELDSLVGMTETLRAQAHEFSNKLHTIIGLIEIGESQEAVAFARDVSLTQDTISSRLTDQVKDPMVTALIFAKGAAAAERSVRLIVDESTHLDNKLVNPVEVLSVLGNLIDNAIDAAALPALQVGWNSGDPGWVRIKLTNLGQDLLIEVEDSGTGIPAELREDIFVDGFSTKQSRHGARRGLGLALIKQVVSKSSGSIEVSNTPGACFKIVLPFSVGPAKPKRAMATKKVPPEDSKSNHQASHVAESAAIKIDQDSSYGP